MLLAVQIVLIKLTNGKEKTTTSKLKVTVQKEKGLS